MNRLLPFAEFTSVNEVVFTRPEMYFNKEKQCLRIADHYLFLKEEIMLESNDHRLNEFLGVDLSTFMPKTTSDWVHLGVDGVASILDAAGLITGGTTSVIAKFIEVIHGLSYFVEAYYKPGERIGLGISGLITLGFAAFMPITGSAQSTAIKLAGKKAGWGVGSIFRTLLSGKIGLAYVFVKKMLAAIGNMGIIKRPVGKIIEKMAQTTIGKMMLQLPVIKTITNFFRKDLDLALEKVGKHMAEDALTYNFAVIRESKPMMMTAYNGLAKDVRRIISPKQFLKLNEAMVHTELTGLPMGGKVVKYTDDALDATRRYWAANQGGIGREAIEKVTKTNVANLNTAIQKASAEALQVVEVGIARDASFRGMKTAVRQEATRKAIGVEMIKHIQTTGSTAGFSVAMKKISGKTIGELALKSMKGTLVVAAKSGIKNAVNNGITKSDSSDSSASSDGSSTSGGDGSSTSGGNGTSGVALPIDTAPSDDAAAKMAQDAAPGTTDTNTRVEGNVKSTENVAELAKAFTEQNHLKLAVVESKEALGNLDVSFSTPKKDNTDGKLILSGDMLAQEFNVTETLHPYEKKENLLIDLKKVKGKDDKTTIRDGEYKKWERSNTFTTPFVTADTGRYVFHFLVRDRSIISLAKKNFDEKLVWAEMLTPGVLEKGYYKINSSLYILVKKVTDKGYDE